MFLTVLSAVRQLGSGFSVGGFVFSAEPFKNLFKTLQDVIMQYLHFLMQKMPNLLQVNLNIKTQILKWFKRIVCECMRSRLKCYSFKQTLKQLGGSSCTLWCQIQEFSQMFFHNQTVFVTTSLTVPFQIMSWLADYLLV